MSETFFYTVYVLHFYSSVVSVREKKSLPLEEEQKRTECLSSGNCNV